MSVLSETLGKKMYVVLLHGWGFDSKIMQPLARSLSHHYPVNCIDLPGYGQSDLSSYSNLDAMAHRVNDLILPRSSLIGWSLGWLVAARLAELYPHRIDKLIAIASTPYFLSDKNWPGISAEIFSSFTVDFSVDPKSALQKFALLQINKLANQRVAYYKISSYLTKINYNKIEVLNSGLKILQTTDLRLSLKRLKLPMQFIFSNDDKLIPIKAAEYIAALAPQATINIVEDAGHIPFIWQPKITLKYILKYLSH